MGAMYLQGLCVEQNDREAFKWFLESAEGGNAQAQYMVGNMYLYHKGVDGDIYSRINAAGVWMGKACDKGVAEACRQAARAKFTEVTTMAGPLKQQVELCYLERGNLDGCSGYMSGKGWDLGEAVREAESSFFVSRAEVKHGVITIYSSTLSPIVLTKKRHGAKEKDFKEIFVPHPSFGSSDAALNWMESTCKEHRC